MTIARSAALSALRLRLCPQCRGLLATRTISQAAVQTQRPVRQRSTINPTLSSIRWHSAPASNSKVYEFVQVKEYSESPSEDRMLIDVREPSEFEAGHIPTAINLPIKSQPDALFLPEEEFEDRFGFTKPEVDKEVVFYCRSGVRSSAAAQLAQQHGYTNVAEYRGSWLDWEKNGGPTGKP